MPSAPAFLIYATVPLTLALVALIGVLQGHAQWGDDYWRYGRLGCVERDAIREIQLRRAEKQEAA